MNLAGDRLLTGSFRRQADLVLAKYTCIALSRVSGSVKKVKGDEKFRGTEGSRLLILSPRAGSLDDVSVRLPMDSPVFSRLANAIQNPSSNKEWYASLAFSEID
jgi:condensin complex subunit 1